MSRAEKSTAEQSGHIQHGVRKAAGVVFMVFGTMCFASKSIFVKWAYEQGAQPEAVLLYRQLFAAPLFWLIFIVYRSKLPAKPEKAEIFKACAAGLLCFFLSPLLDFIGLHGVSATVERMIVMSYPMFVLIITAFVNKKMVSGKTFVAILLVNAGLFLAVGGWDVQALEANLSGAFLILLSAVAYAAYLVVAGGLVRQIGGIRMNAYGMSATSLAMAGYAVASLAERTTGNRAFLSSRNVWFFYDHCGGDDGHSFFIHAGRHEADRSGTRGRHFHDRPRPHHLRRCFVFKRTFNSRSVAGVLASAPDG